MNNIETDQGGPDLQGEFYISTLERLHDVLRPKTYLEVGVFNGSSLALAKCATIAVDPEFQITHDHLSLVFKKPELHFYQMGSDEFFQRVNPTSVFGRPIDMAFLDGMHRCEFLLRDFINTEKHCKTNSVVVLHDCLPIEEGIATRNPSERWAAARHREGWWTGDVWRTSLLLRRYRPDLRLTVIDCNPTGLVMVTNLNPGARVLSENYARFVEEMLSWDLAAIGVQSLFAEMKVESSTLIQSHEDITKRFWL